MIRAISSVEFGPKRQPRASSRFSGPNTWWPIANSAIAPVPPAYV